MLAAEAALLKYRSPFYRMLRARRLLGAATYSLAIKYHSGR